MNNLENNLKKAEKAYEKNKNSSNALALFACYVLAGKTIDTTDTYLSKAYHVAVTAHKDDQLDLNLVGAVLHANVLLNNFESAYELIRQLEPHSSFFSKNMPLNYGQILYFYSIVQARTEKIRSAKKIHRNLEILYEKTGLTPLLAYLGSLQRLVFEDIHSCIRMYIEAIGKGERGVFLYLDVYDILLSEEEYGKELNELSRLIIPWALNKDLPIKAILDRLEKSTLIKVLFSLSTDSLEKIYGLYEHMGVFQVLCQKLIAKGNTSERALEHYKTAVRENIQLRGLEQICAKAAYRNKYYGLPLPAAEAALKNPNDYEPGELAFLFSILVSQTDNYEAINEQRENIVKFGHWSAAKGLRGKDFNAVYSFLYESMHDNEIFAEILLEELFKYELHFKGVVPGCVCVYEYAKSGAEIYRVDGRKCHINSVSSFECCFLDEKGEFITVNDYSITKQIETENHEILEAFYKEGNGESNIVLALAQKYLALRGLEGDRLRLLEKAADTEEISEHFRLDICRALADSYAEAGQHGIALEYYNFIGERNIKSSSLEAALQTYLATGSYDEAVALITKRHGALSYSSISDAIEQLYDKAQTLEIASVCYNLILEDFCSAEILNIVIKKFKGTSDEWMVIANKIDSLGFDASQLYEKIIIDGIFTGSIGKDCNGAFVKLYGKNKNHSIIAKYVYFCCYEIIKNKKLISEELCDILEEIYFEKGEDSLICYALALSYIRAERQDKATIISEASMYMEDEGILLPELKEYQDKFFVSTYIEKNTPFMYEQLPLKNVSLYYKTDEGASFAKKQMKYFRFGIYLANLQVFYGEKVNYYFEEENGGKTEIRTFVNQHMRIIEQFNDKFYTINNALIYEQMMKFDLVEGLIENELENKEEFQVLIL